LRLKKAITITAPKLTVIFDFDGTLADTLVTSIRVFEKMTKRPDVLSEQEIMRLRGMNAFNVVRELHIRPWRAPWMLMRGRALMRREIDGVAVFRGVEGVLHQLETSDVRIFIMSSNSPGNIRKLLAATGLNHYFMHIYGNVGIFGKAKRLRKIIQRNGLEASRVVYVGDEGRDIEAARRAGVGSVAVTWGFNNADLLAKHKPDYMVSTPEELAAALLSLR